MAMVHRYYISPREAWDMTMPEYCLLCSVEKEQPVKSEYDKTEQERIITKFTLKDLENV